MSEVMLDPALVMTHNIDILATAAGYTRQSFLSKARIHPATHTWLLSAKKPFNLDQMKRISNLIYSLNDDWLNNIYELAHSIYLKRIDIFKECTEKLPDKTFKTILDTNLRALRYFLELPAQDVADGAGYSRDTISALEAKRHGISTEAYYNIYECLRKISNQKGKVYKDIFETSSNFVIATKIPKFTRF